MVQGIQLLATPFCVEPFDVCSLTLQYSAGNFLCQLPVLFCREVEDLKRVPEALVTVGEGFDAVGSSQIFAAKNEIEQFMTISVRGP